MKAILMIAAVTGLILTILPSLLVFTGVIAWETHSGLMFAGMILWFGTAPFLMRKQPE